MLALAAAACGDDDNRRSLHRRRRNRRRRDAADTGGHRRPGRLPTGGDGEPVTISWWHIQNNDPGTVQLAGDGRRVHRRHPNVTININVMENEAFKAALQTNLQAGDVPDLFQSWGGGGLREQVEAGLVQDITERSSGFIDDLNPGAVGLYNVDGKQYGVPFDAGMVGFWYNKELFSQAGIEAPPATWDEFLDVVQTAQGRGHHTDRRRRRRQVAGPLLLLVPDGPARRRRVDELDRRRRQLQRPEVIKAGEELQRLIDLEPFQAGFLATPWDSPDGEAGSMGSGQAAMDLMGQWAPGAFRNAGRR